MINNSQNQLPLPPGKLGLPLIGETIDFLNDRKFAQKRIDKYGKIFKTNIFGSNTIVISSIEANKFLFTHDSEYFINAWPPSTKILLGPASLAVQTGIEHQKRRKLLFQSFQPRALANYLPKMQEIAFNYLQKWEKQQHLTWYPEIRNFTFDVACQLLIGKNSATYADIFQWFETWVSGLFSIPLNLPFTAFGKALKARENLLKSLEKIILERQQQPATEQDALGILLQAKDEEGNSLSLAELKDQILVLLFAGHETLTSAIASFCLLVAQHPEVLAKLRSEQEQITAEMGENLSTESLKKMVYLEQVLTEVLRFIPPVGGGFRQVIKDCDFNGYYFPQGWSVLYQIGNTHYDREIYENPDKFDPDRFSTDKTKPFGYIPFGAGIRECLGKEFARLEMRIFAVLLLRNYQWELLPDQDLSMITIPSPRPRDGLKVKITAL
jgi:retinoid hydroxylase